MHVNFYNLLQSPFKLNTNLFKLRSFNVVHVNVVIAVRGDIKS